MKTQGTNHIGIIFVCDADRTGRHTDDYLRQRKLFEQFDHLQARMVDSLRKNASLRGNFSSSSLSKITGLLLNGQLNETHLEIVQCFKLSYSDFSAEFEKFYEKFFISETVHHLEEAVKCLVRFPSNKTDIAHERTGFPSNIIACH